MWQNSSLDIIKYNEILELRMKRFLIIRIYILENIVEQKYSKDNNSPPPSLSPPPIFFYNCTIHITIFKKINLEINFDLSWYFFYRDTALKVFSIYSRQEGNLWRLKFIFFEQKANKIYVLILRTSRQNKIRCLNNSKFKRQYIKKNSAFEFFKRKLENKLTFRDM